MNSEQLIAILERRIDYLSQTRAIALTTGDIEQAERIAADIADTQATIAKLKTED